MYSYLAQSKIKNKNKKINKKKHSLQVRTYNSNCIFYAAVKDKNILSSIPVPLKRRDRGSATVEAVVLLPLFLFAMLAFFQIGQIYMLEEQVYCALQQTALKIAEQAYAISSADDEKGKDGEVDESGKVGEERENEIGEYASVVLGDILSAAYMNEYLKENDYVNRYVINGSRGFAFLQSSYLEDGHTIDLHIQYFIQIRVPIIGKLTMPVYGRVRTNAWLGNQLDVEDEEYVYITDYQSVYHTRRSCSYLTLSIQTVTGNQLLMQGTPACELCGETIRANGVYYITESGGCYHTTLSCSGLKRTIYRVKKSEIGGKQPCSRCGN